MVRCEPIESFQSIGVTKDWRRLGAYFTSKEMFQFPINRRHQGLATVGNQNHLLSITSSLFPINRRHQGMATYKTMTQDRDTYLVSNQ